MDASTSFVFVVLLNKQQIVDHDCANNYGRPELFVAILACTRPDLAIDAGMRVLCVDYLLVKQNNIFNLPEFLA